MQKTEENGAMDYVVQYKEKYNGLCWTVPQLNCLQLTQNKIQFLLYQTEPRYSAYSFFLPAGVLPAYTSFCSFVGSIPNDFPLEVLVYTFCFSTGWHNMSEMACATVQQCGLESSQSPIVLTDWDVDYKYSLSQKGKEIKTHTVCALTPKRENLFNLFSMHFSHHWPELSTLWWKLKCSQSKGADLVWSVTTMRQFSYKWKGRSRRGDQSKLIAASSRYIN